MKSVLVSLQKTVILSANTFDHTVSTVFTILVIFCVEFEETNFCCFSSVELFKISWFGYYIKTPSKVCEFCSKTNTSGGVPILLAMTVP